MTLTINGAVDAVLSRVEARKYDPTLRVNDLLDDMPFHRDYLRRAVVERLRQPLWHYVTHLRLERACVLLVTTNRAVSAVRDAVGYANETTFTHAFHRVYGVSPTRYRRLARLAAADQ